MVFYPVARLLQIIQLEIVLILSMMNISVHSIFVAVDPTLTTGISHLGFGDFTLQCSRDEEFQDIYIGQFSFNRSPGTSEYMNVFANITLSCFDVEGNKVNFLEIGMNSAI